MLCSYIKIQESEEIINDFASLIIRADPQNNGVRITGAKLYYKES